MSKPLPARDELYKRSDELVEALIERIEHERGAGKLACALEFVELGSHYAPVSRALALLGAEIALAAGDCKKSRAFLDDVERLANPNGHTIELARVNELRTSDPMLACAELEEPEFPRIQEFYVRHGGNPGPARPEQAERSGVRSRLQKKCLRPKRFW